MKEPKRYYCGNGEGMFEDNKNGYWIEYSEHKAIVDALTKQLRKHAVVGRSEQLCSCSSKILSNGNIQFSLCRKCQEEMKKHN